MNKFFKNTHDFLKKNDGLINKKITSANVFTLIKAVFSGVLCSEAWYLGNSIGKQISSSIEKNLGISITVGITLAALIFIYMLGRGFFSLLLRILKSKRYDILILFLAGIGISIMYLSIWRSFYTDAISKLNPSLIPIFVIPFLITTLLIIRAICLDGSENERNSYFLNDTPKEAGSMDLLGFTKRAELFAEHVLNNGSPETMVFGIDAPWGAGKSTFVNFCKESWRKDCNNIVYSFNALGYKNRKNLMERFVDGLIRTIQNHEFIPEIKSLISRYSRFIGAIKGSFPYKGINFDILASKYTLEDALSNLKSALMHSNKKIIILIDDLDRLNFSEIQDVLFVIKQSFALPNVTYVLCYDTNNISRLERNQPDIEKITEFFEKFINVKINLYLDKKTLKSYILENIHTVMKNSKADSSLVATAISGLSNTYDAPDYHLYLPFVGDVRKLKRLINTLLILGIEQTDFRNSDFNSEDLINLLLIYVNYPDVFRKIYNTETQGNRGFFSLVTRFDESRPEGYNEKEYVNSKHYIPYLERLSENKKFLLEKLFNATRLKNVNAGGVSDDIYISFACFNGGFGSNGNLEKYLNLIVSSAKPAIHEEESFYINLIIQMNTGNAIDKILTENPVFNYSEGENARERLFKTIVNKASELTSEAANKVITYIINELPSYPIFHDRKSLKADFRRTLIFSLVMLLNKAGWIDAAHPEGGIHARRNNSQENVAEIAEWIFGDGKHAAKGIIENLTIESRGILGLYDLLIFRNYCIPTRGGDTFNIEQALLNHASGIKRTSDTTIDQMREISQKTFKIFNERYIKSKKNIFSLVNELSLSDLAGAYEGYLMANIDSPNVLQDGFKSHIICVIIYHLSNPTANSELACGFYDESGNADQHGIWKQFNKYIFDVCFNPSDNKNYEYFANYMLMNLNATFSPFEHASVYTPDIINFTKILDKSLLASYWRENRSSMRLLDLPAREDKVITLNYTATYAKDLEGVYKKLDELVDDSEDKTSVTSGPTSEDPVAEAEQASSEVNLD